MNHYDMKEEIKKEWLLLLQKASSLGITNEQIKLVLLSKGKLQPDTYRERPHD